MDEFILKQLNGRIRSLEVKLATSMASQDNIKKLRKDLFKHIEGIRFDVDNSIRNLRDIENFITDAQARIAKLVEDTVISQFDTLGLYKVISTMVKRELDRERLNQIIKDVINETLKTMNKKLNVELGIAKKLCYSIDSDIKHIMMTAPVSAESEQLIIKKFNESLQEISNKIITTKKIENKTQGVN